MIFGDMWRKAEVLWCDSENIRENWSVAEEDERDEEKLGSGMGGICMVWAAAPQTVGCQDNCQGRACFRGDGLICNGEARSAEAPGCGRRRARNSRGRSWWLYGH